MLNLNDMEQQNLTLTPCRHKFKLRGSISLINQWHKCVHVKLQKKTIPKGVRRNIYLFWGKRGPQWNLHLSIWKQHQGREFLQTPLNASNYKYKLKGKTETKRERERENLNSKLNIRLILMNQTWNLTILKTTICRIKKLLKKQQFQILLSEGCTAKSTANHHKYAPHLHHSRFCTIDMLIQQKN